MQKLGPMTIEADVGEVSLAPETFTKAGAASYVRDLPPAVMPADVLLPVVFTFDKAVAPFEITDSRELGAVVTEVSLEPRK